MRLLKIIVAACVAAGTLLLLGAPAQAQATLAAVKKRGELVCGVNGQVAAYSAMNDKNEWIGFDVEFCRAIAAATLGDASKVKFVALTALKRFDALKAGEIDLLARNSTLTLQRVAGSGMRAVAVTYIDGQRIVVPKASNITSMAGIDKGSVCITKGTSHAINLEAWSIVNHVTITPVLFDTQQAMFDAFLAGQCTAVTQEGTALASSIAARGKGPDYLMLPEIISKEPLGPYVRALDENWLDIVRWTYYAMLDGEELGITQGNVDEQRQSKNPVVRRVLGLDPGNGKSLGLDESWAYNILKQVGNYGESYERNFGAGSPLKFPRGINALWSHGGALYSLPLR